MVTDVSSTFPRSRISDLVTYTGKQKTLTAVLTAGKDEKGNDIELPVGKTKIKWTTKDKTVAGVSGKKEAGTVKPVNGLKKKDNQAGEKKEVIIEVTAEGRNTKKEPYTFSGSYTLTVVQSNISSVEVDKRLTVIKDNGIKIKWNTIVADSATRGNDAAYVGTGNMYKAVSTEGSYPEGEAGSDAIGWTISGAAAKINDNGYLTPVKPGSSTVSVNYVTLNKDGKAKLKQKNS